MFTSEYLALKIAMPTKGYASVSQLYAESVGSTERTPRARKIKKK